MRNVQLAGVFFGLQRAIHQCARKNDERGGGKRTRGKTHSPVMVNAASALYSRHTMIPDSLRHVAGVHRLPSNGRMFHVRSANPSAQSTVQMAFSGRLSLGGSVRVWCRAAVASSDVRVRTETVRSCVLERKGGGDGQLGEILRRVGGGRRGRGYEEKGPWNVEMLYVQVVHEEGEDAQHDGGREELARAHQVECERGVERWLLGDFGARAG